MSWDAFIERAIGVPYRNLGRDYSGWDCWGLCVMAYREVFGIEIPDVCYESAENFRESMRLFSQHKDRWNRTEHHALGSVALIYRRGLLIHAGLASVEGLILHVEKAVGTVQEPASEMRIEGYYAYAG